MNQLIDAVVARCHALVAGQLFDDPTVPGTTMAMSIHPHFLPIATTPTEKQEQQPAMVVRLLRLEDHQNLWHPVVQLFGVIYTKDGVEEGMADLFRLIGCLRPLADRGPGNFAGYKIIQPIVWHIGDKENGTQPHPFYQCFCELRLVGAK